MLRRMLQVTAASISKTTAAAGSCSFWTPASTMIGQQIRLFSSEEAPRPPFPPFTRETALEKVHTYCQGMCLRCEVIDRKFTCQFDPLHSNQILAGPQGRGRLELARPRGRVPGMYVRRSVDRSILRPQND